MATSSLPPQTEAEVWLRIQQLVRNAHPGCEAIFVDAPPDGLAFRVRARNGRYRSGVITLLRHHREVRLNSAWLDRQMSDVANKRNRRKEQSS